MTHILSTCSTILSAIASFSRYQDVLNSSNIYGMKAWDSIMTPLICLVNQCAFLIILDPTSLVEF